MSRSSNPRSCILKSITVSEVILQHLSTSHLVKLRLGGLGPPLFSAQQSCLFPPHIGTVTQDSSTSTSWVQQEEAVSTLTSHTTSQHMGLPDLVPHPLKCSVGPFLPCATQQWLEIAASVQPGSRENGETDIRIQSCPTQHQHPHLPLELLPSLLFWWKDQPSSLSSIRSLLSSPCSLLWQLPSWEDSLLCHLLFFAPAAPPGFSTFVSISYWCHLGCCWLVFL